MIDKKNLPKVESNNTMNNNQKQRNCHNIGCKAKIEFKTMKDNIEKICNTQPILVVE